VAFCCADGRSGMIGGMKEARGDLFIRCIFLAILALLILIVAVPTGGFVFGFFFCQGCGLNIAYRILNGFLFAFFTVITHGFRGEMNQPPKIRITYGPASSLLRLLFSPSQLV
jgi:hypothetical protein